MIGLEQYEIVQCTEINNEEQAQLKKNLNLNMMEQSIGNK